MYIVWYIWELLTKIVVLVSDMMELKRMMEKLGQAKTHLELKKMIAEVDTNGSGNHRKHEQYIG